MTKERFFQIVDDPDLLRRITYEELKTLALAYPYAHNLRYLLAIKSRQIEHADTEKNIATAAAYSLDRTKLFLLVAPQSIVPMQVLSPEEVLELKPIETVKRELEALSPVAREEAPARTESAETLLPPEAAPDTSALATVESAPLPIADVETPTEMTGNGTETMAESYPPAVHEPESSLELPEHISEPVVESYTPAAPEPEMLAEAPENISEPEMLHTPEVLSPNEEAIVPEMPVLEAAPEILAAPAVAAVDFQPYLTFDVWIDRFNPPLLSENTPVKQQTEPIRKAPETETPKTTGLAQRLAERSVAENQDVISETLAKLYAKQGYRDKAAQMYARLALLFPEKSAYFAAEIDKLKK